MIVDLVHDTWNCMNWWTRAISESLALYNMPLHTIGKVSVHASMHKAITHYW